MKQGMYYTKKETIFTVWSRGTQTIDLLLYKTLDSKPLKFSMDKNPENYYQCTIGSDLDGYYYKYFVDNKYIITDPCSISSSANSEFSSIVDLNTTNPEGFKIKKEHDIKPFTDAVIYEVHVKDYSAHESSLSKYPGKYLGLCEKNEDNDEFKGGIQHLIDLGITHVHLMPINDFITVDDYKPSDYNWGYDPELYNAPEGSYSTNPDDPKNKIYELKTLIHELHKVGIKVILDVVYNHTYKTDESNFNRLANKYYHRTNEKGLFTNGSGCGNEIASEKDVVSTFIIDSLMYWAIEYQVDGFRFDLMALLDKKTIDTAIKLLHSINPDIKIYGEPWTGGRTILPDDMQIRKGSQKNKHFAVFNDDFRDAIKGDNDGFSKGYIQNNITPEIIKNIKTGIVGSIHYSDDIWGFTSSPNETINYFNAHDNLILQDKLAKSLDKDEKIYDDELMRLNAFAFGILLTSQGIPFFHSGNEFMRNKKGDHNSYKSSIDVNGINWDNKVIYNDLYLKVKRLIELRKTYPHFKLQTSKEIKEKLQFINPEPLIEGEKIEKGLIAFAITHDDETLLIVHNPSKKDYFFKQDVKGLWENIYKEETSNPFTPDAPYIPDIRKQSTSIFSNKISEGKALEK